MAFQQQGALNGGPGVGGEHMAQQQPQQQQQQGTEYTLQGAFYSMKESTYECSAFEALEIYMWRLMLTWLRRCYALPADRMAQSRASTECMGH
jgi:hypothetical protein